MNDWDDSPSKNRGAGSAGIMIGLVALLLMLALGAFIFSQGICNFIALKSCTPTGDGFPIGQYLEKAGELTTVKFTDVFIAADTDKFDFWGVDVDLLGNTTVVYAVYGEVRAGINLEEIGDEDIEVNGQSLTLRLPPPEIQNKGNMIVETRSKRYEYKSGPLPPSSFTLTEQLEQSAGAQIIQAACEYGILDEANEQAVTVLKALFETAGFTEVTVVTQPGHCP